MCYRAWVMTRDELLAAALSLSPPDRAKLAQQILDSLRGQQRNQMRRKPRVVTENRAQRPDQRPERAEALRRLGQKEAYWIDNEPTEDM